MKKKEMIQLVVCVVVLAVAGYFIYTQLAPKKPKKPLTYEKITKIDPVFSEEARQRLTNPAISKDYYAPPDLNSGVGNTQPFSPLR